MKNNIVPDSPEILIENLRPQTRHLSDIISEPSDILHVSKIPRFKHYKSEIIVSQLSLQTSFVKDESDPVILSCLKEEKLEQYSLLKHSSTQHTDTNKDQKDSDLFFYKLEPITLEALLKETENQEFDTNTNCIPSLFSCLYKDKTEVETLRLKVIRMGAVRFQSKNIFHRLMLSKWHSCITGNESFIEDDELWLSMGFRSSDPLSNELQTKGILLVLLHLITLKERLPQVYETFSSNFSQADKKNSMISVSSIIMKRALSIFATKDFKKVLDRSADGPLASFMSLYCQIVMMWCRASERARNKSDIREISSITRKMSLNLTEAIKSMRK